MNKGYSLVESLIVITIIIILTVITAPFYAEARAQLALDRSASRLAQDIRFVLEKTLSAETACSVFRHGVHFAEADINQYTLFTDCNSDGDYDLGTDVLIEEISLEAGVRIHSLTTPNSIDVVFYPPDPTVTISGSLVATMTIYSVDYPDKTRTVTVNEVGLIDVD